MILTKKNIQLLGSFVLRSSYTGALFRFIQSQKSAVAVDTLEKLVKYNYTIYVSPHISSLVASGAPTIQQKFA